MAGCTAQGLVVTPCNVSSDARWKSTCLAQCDHHATEHGASLKRAFCLSAGISISKYRFPASISFSQDSSCALFVTRSICIKDLHCFAHLLEENIINHRGPAAPHRNPGRIQAWCATIPYALLCRVSQVARGCAKVINVSKACRVLQYDLCCKQQSEDKALQHGRHGAMQ